MFNSKSIAFLFTLSFVSLFVCGNLYAAEADPALLEAFGKHNRGIHEGLQEMCEAIAESLEEGGIEKSDLSKAIKKIEKNAASIAALGDQHNKEWRFEAQIIEDYSNDLEADLKKGEFDDLVLVLPRMGASLMAMEMMFPRHLLVRMEENFEELGKMAAKSDVDMEDAEPTVENLILNSRQMGFAADAFGKKIWKKFTSEIWKVSRALDDAVEDGDRAKVKSLLLEADKPMAMLGKLI